MKGPYFRWTRMRATADTKEFLKAYVLGPDFDIQAWPSSGLVYAQLPNRPLTLDQARLAGVRLIEAAMLADNGRSVREP